VVYKKQIFRAMGEILSRPKFTTWKKSKTQIVLR